ncbi:MAG: GNAT family N-acetyltransferase [Nitriliruptoraceae bacterium]
MSAAGAGPELRRLEPDEAPSFVRAFRAAFGGVPEEVDLASAASSIEVPRSHVAAHGGQVVATASAFSLALALPGGAEVGCAGVSLVSVRGDHRRRGLLRALLDRILDDARDRGEVLAALWASETPIYDRFGFAPAVPTVEVRLDRDHAALRREGPWREIRLVDRGEARAAFPAIRSRARETRPGMLSRPDGSWDRLLRDEPQPPSGQGPWQHALLPGRGYAVYRLEPDWTAGAPTGTVRVQELHAVDPEATAALWRFVTDVDLASTTVAGRRAIDDPVLALVVDEGRARVVRDWPLQLRVLDLPAVLNSRTAAWDGRLVLEVADPLVTANDGRWAVVAADGRITCEPTSVSADLSLDIRAVAAVLLGGQRTTQLTAAGLVDEQHAGSAARLDRLLHVDVAPWHDYMF